MNQPNGQWSNKVIKYFAKNSWLIGIIHILGCFDHQSDSFYAKRFGLYFDPPQWQCTKTDKAVSIYKLVTWECKRMVTKEFSDNKEM